MQFNEFYALQDDNKLPKEEVVVAEEFKEDMNEDD